MTDSDLRRTWLDRLLSTEPADHARAEAAVREVYVGAGFTAPRHLCWFDSPFAASWALALLVEPHHPAWRDLLAGARGSRAGKQSIEEATAALCRSCGVDTLAAAQAEMGQPRGMSLQYMPQPAALLMPKLLSARMALFGSDVSAMTAMPADTDPLDRAEQRLAIGSRAVLASGLICHPTGTLVASSFSNDYSMSRMAADQEAARGRDAPPLLRACWELADATGLCWPFASGAVFAERPTELHVDENHVLHREDGAAAVYRDGVRVYAWHGLAVPEDWILHPEAIPPAKLRGLDPSLRAFAESRRRAAPAPRRMGPSALLSAKLPSDPGERLKALRSHADGKLPLFARYGAGEHAAVWSELVSRGDAVRSDPLAADALAVAYETMHRVDRNIRTVVSRLVSVGYRFTTPDGEPRGQEQVHVPPDGRAARRLQRLEKSAGTLPLSLRVFYDVVGAVDLIGRHPTIAPQDSHVAPDPLVVIGVDDVLASLETFEDEGLLIVAPDDLHKANISGGDPYAVSAPDPAADARLLNERHDLFFVEYLRLCFRFGGFPGYDGQTNIPAEIESLRSGLLDF